jgi:hypothetical protein
MKLIVPPPLDGTSPCTVDENNGRVNDVNPVDVINPFAFAVILGTFIVLVPNDGVYELVLELIDFNVNVIAVVPDPEASPETVIV